MMDSSDRSAQSAAPDQGPRAARRIFGHDAPQGEFLEAYRSNRLHHAWLISGPKGIGKATLAWRFAKFLIATQEAMNSQLLFENSAAATLDIPYDHPIALRILADSEPTAIGIERRADSGGKLKKVISVEEVRRLREFLSLTSADGAPIVAVVDSPDDLNPSGANAMLKILEEPPPNAYFFLISHAPAGLLPTIRSRCRRLCCKPLSPKHMDAALALLELDIAEERSLLIDLAEGSVGTAVELCAGGGVRLYRRIVELMAQAPGMNRGQVLGFADCFDNRTRDFEFEFGLKMMAKSVARLARACSRRGQAINAASDQERTMIERFSKMPQSARVFAELYEGYLSIAQDALATNIDPVSVIVDMCLDFDIAASAAASGR